MKRSARLTAFVLLVAGGSIFGIEACGGDDPTEGTTPGDEAGTGGEGGPNDRDGSSTDPDGSKADGGGGDGGGGEGGQQEAGISGDSGVSCEGLAMTCGGNKDCCASNVVMGGTFNRSDKPMYPATISTFKLDVYEVTVGRFRKFVEAGKGTQADPPAAGDGAHPKIAASGWDSAFNVNLPATTAAYKAALKCNASYPAWTDAPAGNENRPINCITWFDALAFCAWDGGRLPTEAEWNYAASGGSEQRMYPWGSGIDSTKASYDCTGDGSGVGACSFADVLPVGSKSPQGDGKWGQADLAGNMWEWTLDWYALPYRLTTCIDCADLQVAPHRTFRGGGIANDSSYQTTETRLEDTPLDRDYDVGVRCARSAPP